jgi:multiple antibiotic resistance protein
MNGFLWQAFVTLLVIIDPFAIVPIYMGLTKHENAVTRRSIARKACFIGFILLLSFAFLGEGLLTVLNISEPAFQIAGGFLLLLAAIEMVMAKHMGFRASSAQEEGITAHGQDVAVYPLAIPLLAGPGAFTSMVILMGKAKEISFRAEISVVLLAVTVLMITYTSLRLSELIMKILGNTGTNVLTRVFGIILAGLAFQNIITGVIVVLRSV